MLKVNNISVGYGKVEVVKNLSFEVQRNCNLSIIGPNGCGKTTLLKAIANILPFQGDICIEGQPLNKMKQREISRKIAFMSQSSGVYFSYSIFETVMMGRYLHIKDGVFGTPSEEDRAYVLKCLRAVDLEGVKDKEITKLSGGQLQRVFLARALAQQPDIILLDEPTNHLDLKFQIELIEYLNEWTTQENHCVIGVLHDLNLAMRLSERILVMKDGQVAAIGKIGETISGELLKDVYDIDVVEYFKDSLTKWEGLSSR